MSRYEQSDNPRELQHETGPVGESDDYDQIKKMQGDGLGADPNDLGEMDLSYTSHNPKPVEEVEAQEPVIDPEPAVEQPVEPVQPLADIPAPREPVLQERTVGGGDRRPSPRPRVVSPAAPTVRGIAGVAIRENVAPAEVAPAPASRGDVARQDEGSDGLDALAREVFDKGEYAEARFIDSKERQTVSDVLGKEDIISIIGPETRIAGRLLSSTVAARVCELHFEKNEIAKGDTWVVSADFSASPGPTTEVVKELEGKLAGLGIAAMVSDSSVADRDGAVRSLSGVQLADALSRAAGGGDYDRALAARDVLNTVNRALTVEAKDAVTGGTTTLRPSWANIRDAVRVLDSKRGSMGEAPSLTLEQRALARDAIDEPSRETLRGVISSLRLHLDALTPEDFEIADSTARPSGRSDHGHEAAGELPDEGRVQLLNIRVSGADLELDNTRNLLSHLLPTLVSKVTPEGRPELVIVAGVNYANPAAMEKLLEHCQNQGIPVVMTASRLDDKARPLVGEGAHVLTRIRDEEQIKIVQAIAGTEPRDRLNATHQSLNVGSGWGTHAGTNLGFESGSDSANNSGQSRTSDNTGQAGYNVSQDVVHDPDAPRLPSSEFPKLKVGEAVVIDSSGKVVGVYNVQTGGFVREFTPNEPKPLDLEAKFKELAGERGQGVMSSQTSGDKGRTVEAPGQRQEVVEDPEAVRSSMAVKQVASTFRSLNKHPTTEMNRYLGHFHEDRRSVGKGALTSSTTGILGPIVKRTALPEWLKERFELERDFARNKLAEVIPRIQDELGRPLTRREANAAWREMTKGWKLGSPPTDGEAWQRGTDSWKNDFEVWKKRRNF